MNPITREWVIKAEGDYNSAQRELSAKKNPNYDASCFHAQQCVEKYLKARLMETNISFPKTHDLTYLVGLLALVEPMLTTFEEEFRMLNDYAVEYRYPGETADKETAKRAFIICEHLKTIIRQGLGGCPRIHFCAILVIPAKEGIQSFQTLIDSRLRGNDALSYSRTAS